jgi:hypothetical protein
MNKKSLRVTKFLRCSCKLYEWATKCALKAWSKRHGFGFWTWDLLSRLTLPGQAHIHWQAGSLHASYWQQLSSQMLPCHHPWLGRVIWSKLIIFCDLNNVVFGQLSRLCFWRLSCLVLVSSDEYNGRAYMVPFVNIVRAIPAINSHLKAWYEAVYCSSQRTLVESEPFVRTFSPGSTLEPGLKAFCRRGPQCSL